MAARSDEAALRQHIDKIIEGLRAKDPDALEKLYAPGVVSFDIEPPLQHVGAAAKMKNWLNAFAVFKDLDYEVRDLALTVGDTVAFGHGFGRLSGTLRDGTATPGMWVRVTYCFQKINGTWLIAHDQVSVPLDIPTGKGITTLAP
ncbi:Ketosteroid isomerase homolog [Actinomadura meyerae]|jgi:ketosteroid isomerase-like protein|uniref:Ketosteroid isomerase homolog n=1 Tax=Actinomadura meyerae TaxID=240840 RepID=A0A239NT25_9ACTN|nr:nuclear transport factor 2 family protein [Actinomadura meyerae]SNT57593.1 Ketosteroid isomerase homolog [Actinomadura meyerae]